MPIIIFCPNGHRLKASKEHAGRKASCPKCSAMIQIPDEPRYRMSDSSVVALLGERELQSSVATKPASAPIGANRRCPRCSAGIPASNRICPHCQLYLTE